jgi:hypothetical protein
MLVAKAHADEILRPLAREWASQQQLPEAKRHILLAKPEMVLFHNQRRWAPAAQMPIVRLSRSRVRL